MTTGVTQKLWATYFIYTFLFSVYNRKLGHGATKIFGISPYYFLAP